MKPAVGIGRQEDQEPGGGFVCRAQPFSGVKSFPPEDQAVISRGERRRRDPRSGQNLPSTKLGRPRSWNEISKGLSFSYLLASAFFGLYLMPASFSTTEAVRTERMPGYRSGCHAEKARHVGLDKYRPSHGRRTSVFLSWRRPPIMPNVGSV
jgi:hypothetical protein